MSSLPTPPVSRAAASGARPLVIVSADVRVADDYVWHATPEQYLNGVRLGAEAVPLILPSFGDGIDPMELLGDVDGVLVSGSRSNVHPTCYGDAPSEATEPYDEARDSTTIPLIRAAIMLGVPLFCICRGHQELNVALGGSLDAEIQTLPGRLDHRAPVSDDLNVRWALAHEVVFEPGSQLAGVVGADRIRVNSLHRQAIGRLADGLEVEARATDGTIEAVRVRDATTFAFGVQWHPEYWVRTDAPSMRLFQAFGQAVRARRAARLAAVAEAL
ncbi:gamma-glutamyl-gamma-aminobutyrate hydrolase family protein [Segnochrobactraceae bacterium EtOH-i3]